ncbi:MAG: hypothetical protein IPJ65_07260 [Archangiaceae bacterium]|nr:hypothetical protein [Archangiaceae bacterium]
MSVHAYAVSNLVSGLAASAFTWSNAVTANRSYLNDGRMDRPMVIGASVASGINVIIDFGSPQQLTGVAVLNSNAAVQKANATLKVEASSSSTFGADVNVAKAASTLYSSALPSTPSRRITSRSSPSTSSSSTGG